MRGGGGGGLNDLTVEDLALVVVETIEPISVDGCSHDTIFLWAVRHGVDLKPFLFAPFLVRSCVPTWRLAIILGTEIDVFLTSGS